MKLFILASCLMLAVGAIAATPSPRAFLECQVTDTEGYVLLEKSAEIPADIQAVLVDVGTHEGVTYEAAVLGERLVLSAATAGDSFVSSSYGKEATLEVVPQRGQERTHTFLECEIRTHQ